VPRPPTRARRRLDPASEPGLPPGAGLPGHVGEPPPQRHDVKGVKPPERPTLRIAFDKVRGLLGRGQDQPAPRPSGRADPPPRDRLAIRWFTPRGRLARTELLEDLRHDGGAHLAEIVAEVRRPGVDADRLDLRGIDLRGEDLAGSDLAKADLRGAILDDCKLIRARLAGACLDRASLKGAKLNDADLRGTSLACAELTRADLGGANLERARLEGAVLAHASLRRACVAGVELRGVDLHQADTAQLRREPVTFDYARRRTTRRVRLGKPPAQEPVPTPERRARTRRLRPPERPRRGGEAAGRPRPAGRIIPHESVRVARSQLAGARPAPVEPLPTDKLEEALVELLRLAEDLETVEVTIGGRRRVLLDRTASARARRAG